MAFCIERGIECKQYCTGPVQLKVEDIGSIDGNSMDIIYDIACTTVSTVCSLDIDTKINSSDWVYDNVDVTGRVFDNTTATRLPVRILTINDLEG